MTRKSPVGDMDTLTGAAPTRKQSTRLPEGRSQVRMVQSIPAVVSQRPSGLNVWPERTENHVDVLEQLDDGLWYVAI